MKHRLGFIPILVIGIVLVLTAIAGSVYYFKFFHPKNNNSQSSPNTASSPTPIADTKENSLLSSSPSPTAPQPTNSTKPASPKPSSASPTPEFSIDDQLTATNLSSSISCSGYAPTISFKWNDAKGETIYYLDINDQPWTGQSSPSGWVRIKLNQNTTSYTWNVESEYSPGLMGSDNHAPQNSKTYWWRIGVFNEVENRSPTLYVNFIYPESLTTPPGTSISTPYCPPNATSYNLTIEPSSNMTFKIGQSYGAQALLRDNFGNVVLYQEDFFYSWQANNYNVSIYPSAVCTNGIQSPCPKDHADMVARTVGETTITVSVRRISTSQIVASATFNITVN